MASSEQSREMEKSESNDLSQSASQASMSESIPPSTYHHIMDVRAPESVYNIDEETRMGPEITNDGLTPPPRSTDIVPKKQEGKMEAESFPDKQQSADPDPSTNTPFSALSFIASEYGESDHSSPQSSHSPAPATERAATSAPGPDETSNQNSDGFDVSLDQAPDFSVDRENIQEQNKNTTLGEEKMEVNEDDKQTEKDTSADRQIKGQTEQDCVKMQQDESQVKEGTNESVKEEDTTEKEQVEAKEEQDSTSMEQNEVEKIKLQAELKAEQEDAVATKVCSPSDQSTLVVDTALEGPQPEGVNKDVPPVKDEELNKDLPINNQDRESNGNMNKDPEEVNEVPEKTSAGDTQHSVRKESNSQPQEVSAMVETKTEVEPDTETKAVSQERSTDVGKEQPATAAKPLTEGAAMETEEQTKTAESVKTAEVLSEPVTPAKQMASAETLKIEEHKEPTKPLESAEPMKKTESLGTEKSVKQVESNKTVEPLEESEPQGPSTFPGTTSSIEAVTESKETMEIGGKAGCEDTTGKHEGVAEPSGTTDSLEAKDSKLVEPTEMADQPKHEEITESVGVETKETAQPKETGKAVETSELAEKVKQVETAERLVPIAIEEPMETDDGKSDHKMDTEDMDIATAKDQTHLGRVPSTLDMSEDSKLASNIESVLSENSEFVTKDSVMSEDSKFVTDSVMSEDSKFVMDSVMSEDSKFVTNDSVMSEDSKLMSNIDSVLSIGNEESEDNLVDTKCHSTVLPFSENANSSMPLLGMKSLLEGENSNISFVDESSQSNSVADKPSRSKRSRRSSITDVPDSVSKLEQEDGLQAFLAERVFEYQWPQDGGEWYVLQEQISEYLGVLSFKRKYPDLTRRTCDKLEKDFLREKGVVTETQSDLGLTALRSEEVYDLMMKDYPDKYHEYATLLHEREKQKISDKHKEYEVAQPKLEKSKMADYMKKAAKAAAEYNRHLHRERREERVAFFDLQTFMIQYPANRYKKLAAEVTKPSMYPVALIPGQFQDHYCSYTSDELRYFPLNTALYDPPKKMSNTLAKPAASGESDDEGSEDKNGSTSDTSANGVPSSDSETLAVTAAKMNTDTKDAATSNTPIKTGRKGPKKGIKTPKKGTGRVAGPGRGHKRKLPPPSSEDKEGPPTPVAALSTPSTSNPSSPAPKREKKEDEDEEDKDKCRICGDAVLFLKYKRVETKMIKCSECGKIAHPSCLDLTDKMVQVITTYPWQCMECKTCVECMDPYDEDKMLFCDRCDRGYHTFCVGLRCLPTGHWECRSCKGTAEPVKSRRGRQIKPL